MTQRYDRHIALPGTTNFRDLGGYVGHGGARVCWRQLFRSDHLADLTPQGLQALQTLGVQRSADLRGVMERQADGYAWPGVTTEVVSIEPTVVQKAIALVHSGGQLSVQDTLEMMQETYRRFVLDNTAQFRQLLHWLLAHEGPAVFHCMAGKDRTGWAAAILLEMLGVSRSDIEQDYLLTNQYYQRPAAMASRAAQALPQAVLDVLWRVQPAFLGSAYEVVTRTYGDMRTYWREGLGMDTQAEAALRERYLQPAA